MKLFGKLGPCGTALVVMSALVGCSPAAVPSEASAAVASSPVPTAALASTTMSAKLPTEALPVSVLAISGKNILVQGDAKYRISHDSGKTWSPAHFPCANIDGCSTAAPTDNPVGRPEGGVVTAYSVQANQLDAYSLVKDTKVGSSYVLPSALSVVDLVGGLALIEDSQAGTYFVHSLLDGSDRAVTLPSASSFGYLLGDGSLLMAAAGAGTKWQRIARDGTATTVFTSSPGTGDVLISGNLASFAVSQKKAPKFCLVNLTTAARSCRTGVTKLDNQFALGSTGLLMTHYSSGTVKLDWFAYSGGKLAKVRRMTVLKGWDSDRNYSAENATPLLATWTDSATTLLRPKGSSVSKLKLTWATRPVLPSQLGLGTTAVVGVYDTHSRSYSWTRSLSATKLAATSRLGAVGDVAAAGSHWALRTGARIRVYTAGKLVKTFSGSEETSGLTFAGSYLLGRPSCRKAPLQTDDDCDAPARLYTRSGTSLAVPVGTEDAHGSLLVYRGGDHTVSSTTFVVKNFRDATVAPITITLPSPGAGGYYTDVRIRGDWIGATQHLANGTVYPVLANYRTSTVTVGTTSGRLLELGSGIVVSALAHSTTLQVWQPATGATATIKAASSVVAVDGTRVVYVQSGRLVVARFAG